MWYLLAACGVPDERTVGPLLAATTVLCELWDGSTACATISQQHYPTQEGIEPTNRLTTLSMSGNLMCGVDTRGNIHCGGFDQFGLLDVPAGTFSQVAAGNTHACALDTEGVPTCWGANYGNALEVPYGVRLESLVAGDNRTCGYAPQSSRWRCWGYDQFWLDLKGVVLDVPPDGTVLTSAVIRGGVDLYGIMADGTIGRWGWPDDASYEVNLYGTDVLPVGDGYTRVDPGTWHVCALHETGRIDCWGDNTFGQADVPEGTWTDVAAGESFTCGRHTDGRIRCWGCGGTCTREWPTLP